MYFGGADLIKGCNKRVIVMKDTGNEMIEEAFFILKPEASKSGVAESEIIKHANRILDKSLYGERFSQLSMNVTKKKKSGFVLFFFGALIGVVVTTGIFLML